MSKLTPLPKSKKFPGLHIQCSTCNRIIDDGECRRTGRKIGQDCPGNHAYKAVVHVPGTRNTRKAKILESATYEGAVKELIEFKASITRIGQSESVTIPVRSSPQEKAPERPHGFLALAARYVGYLHNDPEIVPEYQRRERSPEHLTDIERTIKYLVTALSKSGVNIQMLRIDELNAAMIGKFHSYLLDDHQFSDPSYNRAMSHLTSFYRYLIEQEGYAIANPFLKVPRKALNPNKEVVRQPEYEALLEIIQKPELGIQVLSTGERKNLYKAWMKDAIELGLTTGKRIEEIVELRWTDLIHDEDGRLLYARVPDYKVIRQKRLPVHKWKYRYIPAMEDFKETLKRLGYPERKDTDGYILAPDENMSRRTIRRFITRSFTHYYKQLGTGRKLTYKNLRKSHLTQLTAQFGSDHTRVISGHSNPEVLEDNYVDEREIAETAEGFRLFKKGKDRGERRRPERQNRQRKPRSR